LRRENLDVALGLTASDNVCIMYVVVVLQQCDIAINWSGGLHHAKKYEVRNVICVICVVYV